MVARHLWHPWPGRCWPLLRDEEITLVQELEELADKPLPFERGDVTLVLNMIRTGVSAAYVQQVLPGLSAARMLSAYQALESKRSQALLAWGQFHQCPSLEALNGLAPAFEPLFPLALQQLAKAAARGGNPLLIERASLIVLEMEKAATRALEIEALLSGLRPPSEYGVSLGRKLYDPYSPGLWGEAYYPPVRVGSLTPVRVRALLGESRV